MKINVVYVPLGFLKTLAYLVRFSVISSLTPDVPEPSKFSMVRILARIGGVTAMKIISSITLHIRTLENSNLDNSLFLKHLLATPDGPLLSRVSWLFPIGRRSLCIKLQVDQMAFACLTKIETAVYIL